MFNNKKWGSLSSFLSYKHLKPKLRVYLTGFNIQSSFTVQNPRTQLVKIEHVILLYLTSANSNSALLTITHKNRALLTMAVFFVNVFSL